MTSAKPPLRVEDIGIPNYLAIREAVQELLGSLDRRALFPKWEEIGPLALPDVIAESHAEAYVKLRMKLVGETVARTYTPAQVAAQVGEVADAAEALVRALWRVGGEAADALNVSNAPWYDPFGATAPTIFDCQNMASYLAKKAKSAAPNGETAKRRGPARSRTTHKIALLAACDFFAITGKKPTRSKNKNQFSEFLFELFKALMIDAQASAFSQTAVEKWRALTPDQRSNVMTGHFPSETAVKN